MALTRFSGTDEIIRPLDDQPNDNDGLSAAELKAKFDQFGATFKSYFNNIFIPEVESAINAAATGIGTSGFSGAIITDGTITAEKLSTTSGAEAVSTSVVRDGAITQPKLAASVQAILNSVAGKTTHSTTTAVLLANGWSDNEQTVTATGVTTGNVVIAVAGVDDDSHTLWSNNDIHAVAQGANTLTFKCRTAPSVNVNVNILILNQGG